MPLPCAKSQYKVSLLWTAWITAVIASPQGRGNLLVLPQIQHIVPGDRHGAAPLAMTR